METIHSIGVDDALEQLSYPSFFDRSERQAAFNFVMLWGDAEERGAAEKAKERYPFEDPDDTLFPQFFTNDFPVVSRQQHA